jgi:sulfate transport system ATP-binding protein
MGIYAKNITKNFKDFAALDNVSLEVKSGELVALLGPSGSGKTTLLRIIAGLEVPDGGSIILDGQDTSKKTAKDRHVGFVFQHYALFKHMTVFENVAFGLRVRPKETRPSNDVIKQKVMELLELVHLDSMYNRYPSQLSGGQRQRVALARALAVEPKVLLLDEPFGALDAKVRQELRRWMRRLHDELHITSIFVTHDQEEAMEVSDRVVVMSNGRIEQVGTPEEVYHAPANAFVYDFLGNYNEFEGWKDEDGSIHLTEYDVNDKKPIAAITEQKHGLIAGITSVVNKIIPGLIPGEEAATAEKVQAAQHLLHGKPVKLYARPHEIHLAKEPDDKEYISAKVVHINPAGSLVKLELERKNGKIIQAEVPKSVIDWLEIKKDDEILARPKQTKVFE